MRDQSDVARRLESTVQDTLLDYFTLYLPVQLLMIDAIGLERRSVPAPTEFCLRAVAAGLVKDDDIIGFLGVDAAYGRRLLAGLCDGEYLGKDAFGRYQLLRRGTELLKQDGEASPSDRRMPILWDPVQKTVLDRTLVFTKQRTDPDGIIAPIPNAFVPPDVDQLRISDINKLRADTGLSGDTSSPSFDILRVTGIHKSFGRYRPSLAMIFTNSVGELTFRLAINGAIDNDLTNACTGVGLQKLIGVEKSMSTRPGVQAIRKRYLDLHCGDSDSKNVAQIVKRRSVLKFKLSSIEARLAEEPTDSLREKKAACVTELEEVTAGLLGLPVVPVRCHEIDYYLTEAFDKARQWVTITTTNPSVMKVDGEILRCLRNCLARGVKVTLYISDRFGENDQTLASFDKLTPLGRLSVHFLQNDLRSVFEIEWDGTCLLFSNEPPLGHRRRPIQPREFIGYFVSDEKALARYRDSFLTFESKDFLKQIRPVATVKAKTSSARTTPKKHGVGRQRSVG